MYMQRERPHANYSTVAPLLVLLTLGTATERRIDE